MDVRIIFFIVVIGLWLGIHVYLGWSLLNPSRLKAPWRSLAWTGVLSLAALGPATMTLTRWPGAPAWVEVLVWAGFIYMGFFSLILFMTVTRDLVFLVLRPWLKGGAPDAASAGGAAAAVPTASAAPDPSRRAFLTGVSNAGILGASGALSALGYGEARREPAVVEVDVPVKGLPESLKGFRIVQISDIHVGPTIRRPFVETVVNKVNTLNADLVAITGDMIDGTVAERSPDVAPLASLKSRHGTFYVTGNHEYYWNAPGWVAKARALGMTPLINEHRLVEHPDGGRVVVAGVTDYREGARVPGQESSPPRAIEGAPDADFKLLLAHQPRSVFAAAGQGYDLQISGHTHGGQFAPWSFLVWLAQPFTAGLHRYKDMLIYVSRGTGYWGPPLRLAAPSEITLLKLTPEA